MHAEHAVRCINIQKALRKSLGLSSGGDAVIGPRPASAPPLSAQRASGSLTGGENMRADDDVDVLIGSHPLPAAAGSCLAENTPAVYDWSAAYLRERASQSRADACALWDKVDLSGVCAAGLAPAVHCARSLSSGTIRFQSDAVNAQQRTR